MDKKHYISPLSRYLYLANEEFLCTSKFGAGQDPYKPESEKTNGHEGFQDGGSIWGFSPDEGEQ